MTAATINTTAIGLQGRPLAATAPTTNQLVGWNGTTWTPSGPYLPLTGGTLTGNLVTSGNIQTTGGIIESPGNAGSFLNGAGVNIVSGRAAVSKSGLSTAFLTSSTNLVMAGMACQFTPRVSGLVILGFSCQIATDTADANCNIVGFLGTGTPPTQGQAQTGSSFGYGATLQGNAYSISMWVPWAQAGVWSGLTIGTTYWTDIGLCNNSGAGGSAYAQWAMCWVGEV
jgi:hypothetical protein